MSFRPVPHGHTARRLTWEFLPPELRREIEGRLGSRVARADSKTSGFTPGFASVLTGEDGSQLFVKAANRVAQAPFAAAYAEEARKLHVLGPGIPAPRLLWMLDGDWLVLGFEAVDGRPPLRPWVDSELERALDVAAAVAQATHDVPDELGLTRLTDDLPGFLTGWEYVEQTRPDWPHLAEAAALARRFDDVPSAFAHADLRDDNLLLTDDGRALVCDWNWPGIAPECFDALGLLLSAHGDGLEADKAMAAHPFTCTFDDEHVDVTLASMAGFMLAERDKRVVPTSPHLRDHNNAWAEAAWSWLAQRRGWDR